ncbi:MAG: alpha/beta fold hydrolase [Salinibacter sp.]
MPTSHIRTPAGRMAYTDVGSGPSLVFLHGNPTSARLYRHLIETLSPEYRCVAPDYLGFGRSEAPAPFSYRPAAHATLVERLLRGLGLTDVTLVLHDWGGPIGLAYALRHPDVVRRLVLTNTWAWPLTRRPLIQLFGRIAGTAAGRMAVERGNAFARLVMPFTVGGAGPARPDWLRRYGAALDSQPRRRACWTFAHSLLSETNWLRALWTRRHRLRGRPALLCWGLDDPAFGTTRTLARWQTLFPDAPTHRFPNVGHYTPEELGPALVPPVARFLRSTAP